MSEQQEECDEMFVWRIWTDAISKLFFIKYHKWSQVGLSSGFACNDRFVFRSTHTHDGRTSYTYTIFFFPAVGYAARIRTGL